MSNNSLLVDVRDIVRQCNEKDVRFVGHKPWYDRAISKFKFGLSIGVATGIVGGLSALAILNHNNFNHEEAKPTHVVEGKIQQKEKPNPLALFRAENPDLNFENIKNPREVSKNFIGKNNFIALAAEMEGFRGDLHKDPATGLNIGFGYNITKRAALSKTEVIQDLQSIGLSDEKITKIVEISQKSQKNLSKAIKDFNNEFKLENNQLITLEQGVALLKRTENEYRKHARISFIESFDKMAKHQQEVLTYAAYKAGYEALSKYKKAIKTANVVYAKKKQPSPGELKSIAKELTFYYAKDGKEMVLDERATLIANTFVSQDYLGLQIGKTDTLKHSPEKLFNQKIDFSHLKSNLSNDIEKKKHDISGVLEKLRKNDKNEVKNKPKYG